MEPEPKKLPFIWSPKEVKAGFGATICGACSYTQFYPRQHTEILEAHKRGYTNQTYGLNIIPNL